MSGINEWSAEHAIELKKKQVMLSEYSNGVVMLIWDNLKYC